MKNSRESLTPDDIARLDELADQFEAEYRAGSAPLIEGYLQAAPDLGQSLLQELLTLEIQLRKSSGDVPDGSEYMGRFPNAAQLIAEMCPQGQDVPVATAPDSTAVYPGKLPNVDDDSNNSVLARISETHIVEPIALRDADAEPDPVQRPNSPNMPNRNTESRYQLHGEIARGGMGAIIKGRDTDLGRDLAIKVLLDSHKDRPNVIQRFVEEAQIGGQLQHPGIVPVYELGLFTDERPFFSMKLVKGKTLSDLLAERSDPTEDRSRYVGIFEQVCQTMAYSHSRGVIHRDLKPANIMVGAFGEVQVMDWGLAKVLATGGVDEEAKTTDEAHQKSVIQTMRTATGDTPVGFDTADFETQMGSVLGTPAYMPPEQALGEVDMMNERSDVFGLGAVLCEILTGKPPYVANDGMSVFRQASRGKLDDCWQRLEACGADEELVKLAKRCLEVESANRPANAGELASRITGHLESVETRLRETELERATEAARVVEARKRQRVTVALAASILLMMSLGGGGWFYWEQQRAQRITQATNRVNQALTDARVHRQLAMSEAAEHDPDLSRQLTELQKGLAKADDAITQGKEANLSQTIVQSATELQSDLSEAIAAVRQKLSQIELDQRLLLEFDQIRNHDPETGAESDVVRARRYRRAFANAGLHVDSTSVADAVEWIKRSTILEPLLSVIDDWSMASPDKKTRERLREISNSVDYSKWRKELRVALANNDTERLLQAANAAESSSLSPELATWLGVALRNADANSSSTDILERAQLQNPDDFWVNMELGKSLNATGEVSRSIRYFQAAIALRPRSLVASNYLCVALSSTRRYHEHEQVARQSLRHHPEAYYAHFALGFPLRRLNKLTEAESSFRRSIELNPDWAPAHNELGLIYLSQDRFDDAIEEFRTAIAIEPAFAHAHYNLGRTFARNKAPEEAEVAYRKAVELNSQYSFAHLHLGHLLRESGRLDEAREAFEKATAANSSHHEAHVALGFLLWSRGQFDEAADAYRRATTLRPNSASYHRSFAKCLLDQGKFSASEHEYRLAIKLDPESSVAYQDLTNVLLKSKKYSEAEVATRRAIELDPRNSQAHTNLGSALRNQGKTDEAKGAFRRAIELDSEGYFAYLGLGKILSNEGKQEEALVAFRRTVELRPSEALHHNWVGITLYRLNRHGEAIEAFQRAFAIDPQDSYAARQIAFCVVAWAKLLADEGRSDDLIKLIPGKLTLPRDAKTKQEVLSKLRPLPRVLELLAKDHSQDLDLRIELVRSWHEAANDQQTATAIVSARELCEKQLRDAPEDIQTAAALAEILLLHRLSWSVLEPTLIRSEGGATMTLQKDKTVLVSGTNPENDEYEIESEVDVNSLEAIRLDVFRHTSLLAGGYGRSENGNVCLTEIEAEVSELSEATEWQPLEILYGYANCERQGTRGHFASDKDEKTHWSVWTGTVPVVKTAVFHLAKPRIQAGRVRLRIRMRFASPWEYHQFGRFRLSVLDDAETWDDAARRLSAFKLVNAWDRLATAYEILNEEDTFRDLVEVSVESLNRRQMDIPPTLQAYALLQTGGSDDRIKWQTLRPKKLDPAEVPFDQKADGSILAGPEGNKSDCYTILAENTAKDIVAVRLEMLPDDSLPSKGPGYSKFGSFTLFELKVISGEGEDRDWASLSNAAASYAWADNPVSNAIDRDAVTRWKVARQSGQAQTAVFLLSEPLTVDESNPLTIELHQWPSYALGRFRLSVVTKSDIPWLAADQEKQD